MDLPSAVRQRFPFRLHDMLNDAEAAGEDHIVSWLPCGKLFKVHKHKEFASTVMPKYCRHTRYKSFLRQLSMYKFHRINKGPNRGAYHHPNFQRNRFDLIEFINRKDRNGPACGEASEPAMASRSMKEDMFEELDFSELDESTVGSGDAQPAAVQPLQSKELKAFNFQSYEAMISASLASSTLSQTPKDILDEIICTFGRTHVRSPPREAMEVASRCA